MSKVTVEKDPATGHTVFHYQYRHRIEIHKEEDTWIVKASNKEETGALPPLDLLELKALRDLIDCAVDEEEDPQK